MASLTNASHAAMVCENPVLLSASGVWAGEDPLHFTFSLFVVQIATVVLISRVLEYILRPLHQPRVVAEIIGGIVLGPSVLGEVSHFTDHVFPKKSMITLDTVANLGLLYFLFLMGVESDILLIKRMGRKAMAIAVGGMFIPFVIGIVVAFPLRHKITHSVEEGPYLLFLGVTLSVTAFPVLGRILADMKLLNTELGRVAMSSAIVNDIFAWVLLAISITLAEEDQTALSSLWVIISGVVFVLFCFYVVRPAMWWLIHHLPEGEGVSDFYVCLILVGVMMSGFITDAIGIHSVFGAFVFGLVIPNGPLGEALIDKLEDFVNGLLLPLFFVISGLKTDLSQLRNPAAVFLLILVFVLASAGKIIGTVLISLYYNTPFRESLSLAFLVNTRGLVEMIVLNIGRDQKVYIYNITESWEF